MKTIYSLIQESREEKLSNDFELVKKNPLNTTIARKYLKELDSRVATLGLTYEQCREAAKLFKLGSFEAALKKIWKVASILKTK